MKAVDAVKELLTKEVEEPVGFPCGKIVNLSGEIVTVYCRYYGDEAWFYYDNDPYGIVSISGIKSVEIMVMDETIGVSSVKTQIESDSRCKAGIIWCSKGFIYIEDAEYFTARFINNETGEASLLSDTIDVCDLEPTAEEYAEVAALIGIL